MIEASWLGPLIDVRSRFAPQQAAFVDCRVTGMVSGR
jgi:hypothetical protein